MDARHLQELIDLEETYWWHVAKRRLVVELLPQHLPSPGLVVEGGIGSARTLVELERLGYDVVGLDILPEAIANANWCGLENVHLHDLEEPWPIAQRSAKAVLLLDVLEHVANPVKVLSNARTVLAPGGGLIFNVPAYPSLYSDWDRSLGHHRRYTARMLEEQAREAGFRLQWMSHWNAFTLPAAFLYRKLDSVFSRQARAEFPRVSSPVNKLLVGCANLERRMLRRFRLPFGLSLMGVLTP